MSFLGFRILEAQNQNHYLYQAHLPGHFYNYYHPVEIRSGDDIVILVAARFHLASHFYDQKVGERVWNRVEFDNTAENKSGILFFHFFRIHCNQADPNILFYHFDLPFNCALHSHGS